LPFVSRQVADQREQLGLPSLYLVILIRFNIEAGNNALANRTYPLKGSGSYSELARSLQKLLRKLLTSFQNEDVVALTSERSVVQGSAPLDREHLYGLRNTFQRYRHWL
jgi:hypothetical protein